jgi:hypothetical protein
MSKRTTKIIDKTHTGVSKQRPIFFNSKSPSRFEDMSKIDQLMILPPSRINQARIKEQLNILPLSRINLARIKELTIGEKA